MRNTYDSRLVPETAPPTDLFTASVAAAPAYTVVRLTGEWDVTVSGQLRGVLAAQVLAGSHQLVVDLSGLIFLDLSCLYALLEALQLADRAGGTLQLMSPPPLVTRLMALLDADRLFAVSASVADATGQCRADTEPISVYRARPG